MRLGKPSTIDRAQWLQSLGVAGQADDSLEASLQAVQDQLLQAAVPQGTYRVLGLQTLALKGTAIQKHLDGCHQMAVMAVTLGAAVDQLIRASQIRNMADAVILDCGASVLVEQVCDAFEEQIKQENGCGRFMTGRFSPGYGDLPIETQDQLIKVIDGPRKIGLTVNQNHIMIPRKSVTAILGIADHPVKGYLATCDECMRKDICVLRKEGKNCAGI